MSYRYYFVQVKKGSYFIKASDRMKNRKKAERLLKRKARNHSARLVCIDSSLGASIAKKVYKLKKKGGKKIC